MRYTGSLLLFLTLLLFGVPAQAWTPDLLGDGYEMEYVDQPADYEGPVRSAVVRKLVPDSVTPRAAVLYIHGFNDYFFQKSMGDEFVDHGYDFYAVDLRRYGRSIMSGQKPFRVRNIDEYFPDIDSAVVRIRSSGVRRVVLCGHSTGGLIASCYLSRNPQPDIKALVLNSPFLDWNLGWKEKLVPLISFWGKFFPDTRISQGDSDAYSSSLLASGHGEWTFNTDWKMPQSPDVDAGWVRAITMAQKSLRDGKARIDVPILLMYSARSVDSAVWTPGVSRADCVLDVADIRKYGRELGPDVTCVRVEGGIHDLVLSAKNVREPLYRYIFMWLGRELPAQKH